MVRTAPALQQNLVLDPRVEPTSRRIVDAVLRAIEDGSLVDDDPLPSTRRFAETYGVARSTVVEAYETLGGLGLVRAAQGSGTRVVPGARELLLGLPDEEAGPAHRRRRLSPDALDLTVPGGANPDLLNLRDWHRAWREATDPRAAAVGKQALSQALTDHLRSFRGMVLKPEQLLLRPGLGSALGDLVHGLELSGRSVAIEDPGYPRLQRHLIDAGCRVHCVPVDDEGLRIDLLTRADRAVIVTPARQWPTGVAMSARRRAELLAWSVRTGGVIVEHDLDAEFIHGPKPTLFAGAGDEARVVYLGSFDKLIAAELALAWLVVAPGFRQRSADVADVSGYSAQALAQYLSSGALYRHRNRVLTLVDERRVALLAALQRRVPAARVVGDLGGTELAIQLPAGRDELAVQLRLEDAGFRVSTLGDFAMRRHRPALLVHFAELTPTKARAFADALAGSVGGGT